MRDNHTDIVILNIKIISTENSILPYAMFQEGKIKKAIFLDQKLYFWTKMLRFLCKSLMYL